MSHSTLTDSDLDTLATLAFEINWYEIGTRITEGTHTRQDLVEAATLARREVRYQRVDSVKDRYASLARRAGAQ